MNLEAIAGCDESRGAHIEVDIGRIVARALLAVLPELGGYRRAVVRVPARRPGQAPARFRFTRPDGAGHIDASRFGDGRAIGIRRIRVAVKAWVQRICAQARKIILRYITRPRIPVI